MTEAARAPTVLLVGEAGSLLQNLEVALRTSSVAARFLATPRNVVAEAAAKATDLVVVDASVQSVSWWAAVAALQREPQTCSVPVAVYASAADFDFVTPIILGSCDVLGGDDPSVIAERLFFLIGELSVRPPTSGGDAGVDAAARLVAYADRVALAGALYLVGRGAGEPDGLAVFEDGRLAACAFARLQGEAALAAMLGLRAGSYYFQKAAAPKPATPPRGNPIPSPGQFLEGLDFLEPLLEGGEDESSRATRIVVVEDDADQLELILDHLRDKGFECWSAVDGAKGLQLVIEVRPDVVISDLQMPALDGWGLLRSIRADHRISDTPVLVLSALEDFRESLRAASAGAQEYVSKSGFQNTLVDAVRGALCHRWQLESAVVKSGRATARVELVGARSTLIRMSEILKEGRVATHDGWSGRVVVSFSGGNAVSAHGGSLSGEAALAAFLAARRGDLSVESGLEPLAANLAGPILDRIEAAAIFNNAAEASALDATLAAGTLGLDRAMYGFYQKHGPPEGRRIAEEIARGVSPKDLLSSPDQNRAHVEEIVRDLVRRRVVVFRPRI